MQTNRIFFAFGRFVAADWGLNLYGYAEGDPANFSDPFGLEVCVERGLRKSVENAFNVKVTEWDENGCVKKFERRGGAAWSTLQDAFERMVNSEYTFRVQSTNWYNPRHWSGSVFYKPWFGEAGYLAVISGSQAKQEYGIDPQFGLCAPSGVAWSAEALIVHELVGHGLGIVRQGKMYGQDTAIAWENVYNEARGSRPLRSRHKPCRDTLYGF